MDGGRLSLNAPVIHQLKIISEQNVLSMETHLGPWEYHTLALQGRQGGKITTKQAVTGSSKPQSARFAKAHTPSGCLAFLRKLSLKEWGVRAKGRSHLLGRKNRMACWKKPWQMVGSFSRTNAPRLDRVRYQQVLPNPHAQSWHPMQWPQILEAPSPCKTKLPDRTFYPL